jgi:membrane-bound lytic murein transglycosylase A
MSAAKDPLASAPKVRGPRELHLVPLSFAELAGFAEDDHLEAFAVFARSCIALAENKPALRNAVAASHALRATAQQALRHVVRDAAEARRFFEASFLPCHLSAKARGQTAMVF